MKRLVRNLVHRYCIDMLVAFSLLLFTSLHTFGSSIFTLISSTKKRLWKHTKISSFQSSSNSRKQTPNLHGWLKYSQMNSEHSIVSSSSFWVSLFSCMLEKNSRKNTSALDAVNSLLKCFNPTWERNIACTANVPIKVILSMKRRDKLWPKVSLPMKKKEWPKRRSLNTCQEQIHVIGMVRRSLRHSTLDPCCNANLATRNVESILTKSEKMRCQETNAPLTSTSMYDAIATIKANTMAESGMRSISLDIFQSSQNGSGEWWRKNRSRKRSKKKEKVPMILCLNKPREKTKVAISKTITYQCRILWLLRWLIKLLMTRTTMISTQWTELVP